MTLRSIPLTIHSVYDKMLRKMAEVYFLFFILIIIIAVELVQGVAILTSGTDKADKIVLVYPDEVASERDLTICESRSGCNVLYKRFWLPMKVERLCRCPHRTECSRTWSDPSDNQTLSLDNRSQIKFCSDLSDLLKCSAKKPALFTTIPSPQVSNVNDAETARLKHHVHRNSNRYTRRTDHKNVTVMCNCEDPHYWKLNANATVLEQGNVHLRYNCAKLKKCAALEFCGFMRVDTHSTFYRCSCPREHWCISKDKTVYQAEELLYNGPSYKAYCFPRDLP